MGSTESEGTASIYSAISLLGNAISGEGVPTNVTDNVKLGFVCVQNAGRSQMSAAFARRERDRRGLNGDVEILTGGTDPAEEVHPEVVEAMAELDVDISDRQPQAVSTDELNDCDVVATMGCSTLELDADVDVRDWALEDPHGKDLETVREIRGEIEGRVADLFEEFVDA
jgi:arsenate reductase